LTVHFRQGSVGTYIRRGGHAVFLEIYSGVTVLKVIEIG